MPEHGDLKIWHIPQVPGQAFEVEVNNLREAKLLLDVLAKYDAFQFEHNVRPDYCNAAGLMQFDANDDNDSPTGSWCEWSNEDGYTIDEVDVCEVCGGECSMKFHQLAIGDTFESAAGQCTKIGPREYRLSNGALRRTSGTANVNGPSGDKLRAAAVKAECQRLNEIAQACGYDNWYVLERAALAGEKITINN